MLSGTVRGLLALGGLAMTLALDAFPRLTPLALGAIPLLLTLPATRNTLVIVVPTIPLNFHASGRGTLA